MAKILCPSNKTIINTYLETVVVVGGVAILHQIDLDLQPSAVVVIAAVVVAVVVHKNGLHK